MITPESKLHLRQRPHPIRPLRHAVIRQLARRFLALAGRGRACSARPPLPRAERGGGGGGGTVAKGGAAEGVSGTARPGDRRPPGSGPPALRGLPRGRWRGGVTNGPLRPAPVNQPRVREGVGGPTPAPQAAAISRGGSVSREGQSRRPGQPQD